MDIITDQYKIENMGRIEATKKQQQQKVVRVFACNFYKLTKVYIIVGREKVLKRFGNVAWQFFNSFSLCIIFSQII